MTHTISGTSNTCLPWYAARAPLDRGRLQPRFALAFRPAAFPLDPHIGPHPRPQRTAGVSRTINGTFNTPNSWPAAVPTSGTARPPIPWSPSIHTKNRPDDAHFQNYFPLNQLPVPGRHCPIRLNGIPLARRRIHSPSPSVHLFRQGISATSAGNTSAGTPASTPTAGPRSHGRTDPRKAAGPEPGTCRGAGSGPSQLGGGVGEGPAVPGRIS